MEIHDYGSFALGIACLGYGVYSLVIRVRSPGNFGKLEPMKEFWGPKRGMIIHVVAYTVAPLVAGIIFVLQAVLVAS